MIRVPLAALPSQTLAVVLGGQACSVALRQNGANIYFDLTVNREAVVSTRICRNRQRLLLDAKYRRFVGDFLFIDTQGDTQPFYTGLGDRYQLYYLEANEVVL